MARGSSIALTTPSSMGCSVVPATRMSAPRAWKASKSPFSANPTMRALIHSTGFVWVVNWMSAATLHTAPPARTHRTDRHGVFDGPYASRW